MKERFKYWLKTGVGGLVFGFLLYSAVVGMLAVASGARVFRYQGF